LDVDRRSRSGAIGRWGVYLGAPTRLPQRPLPVLFEDTPGRLREEATDGGSVGSRPDAAAKDDDIGGKQRDDRADADRERADRALDERWPKSWIIG